jgi:hypothetical protein
MGMRTGEVTLGWAQREHGAWAAEVRPEVASRDGGDALQ